MTENVKRKTYNLNLGWLYPELMSTYGDRGNITVLQKKAEDNNIQLNLIRINQDSNPDELDNCDIIFMGGAQDLQQEIVNKDLLGEKGEKIIQLINDEVPGLFICGAYQFLGKYFIDSYGNKIRGLGLFDMYTQTPVGKPRLIGNIVAKPLSLTLGNSLFPYLVGFENHGGRTYLEDKTQAFATVRRGHGNNGKDKTEGIQYKNAIGTYLHGPVLPANPELADHILKIAFERKFGNEIVIKPSDYYARKAKSTLLKRLHIIY